MDDSLSRINKVIGKSRDSSLYQDNSIDFDPRVRAPNAIEWTTQSDLLNSYNFYKYTRQYQVIRDLFQLRCPLCNSQDPNAIDCWDKTKEYLESETLLVWSALIEDDICPKCKNTRSDFVSDGLLKSYNTMIGVAGMRSGKSIVAGIIATYVDHVITTIGSVGRGNLQKVFGQHETQDFEIGFAATTATQTEKTVYERYRQLRFESPWFRKYVSWVKHREKYQPTPEGMKSWEYKELNTEIYDGFLKVRYPSLNKNSAGLAGQTRIAVFIDELARFGTTESAIGAHEVWQVLHNSLKTLKIAASKNIKIPQWIGLAVSTSSPISITDKQWELMSKGSQVPNYYTFHYATWEFHPDYTKADFDEEYLTDPIKTERDFGANPPAAANPLVADVKRFWQAIDWKLRPTAKFVKTSPRDKTGREYVGLSLDEAVIDRRFDRYIRVDAGKSFDAFAIACAHGEWIPNVSGMTEETLREMDPEHYQKMLDNGVHLVDKSLSNESEYSGYYPSNNSGLGVSEKADSVYITVFDWVVRILAEKNPKKTVWFDSICSIVRKLKQYVNIIQVRFDHWNSEASIQIIRDMGIDAGIDHIKFEDFMKFLNDANAGKVRLLGPEELDRLNVEEDGKITHGSKMGEMTGQGCGLLEIIKLERSPDLRRIYNPNKGKVIGENSDDLAQVMVGVHRQVQLAVYAAKNSREDKLKRSAMGGQGWANRGGIFRLSRWT